VGQICAIKTSAKQISPAEICAAKAGSFQTSATKGAIAEQRVVQVGGPVIRVVQTGSEQACPLQPRSCQFGVPANKIIPSPIPHAGLTKIGVREVDL
jgi:hypothetical protein